LQVETIKGLDLIFGHYVKDGIFWKTYEIENTSANPMDWLKER